MGKSILQWGIKLVLFWKFLASFFIYFLFFNDKLNGLTKNGTGVCFVLRNRLRMAIPQ